MLSVKYKQLKQYPGYRIGDDGTVWSCWSMGAKSKQTDFWRQLTGHRQRYGHTTVQLGPRDSAEQLYIHRLVLETFVGPCPEGHCARHLNGSASDNRLENLTWGTPAENSGDMVKHGTSRRGERARHGKLTEDNVRDILKLLSAGEPKSIIAARYGVCVAAVRAITRGYSWNHVTGLTRPQRYVEQCRAACRRYAKRQRSPLAPAVPENKD